ncbi:hypothetical protein LLH23_04925 [bacterium]|nr:hypothetical protein [bacterium]
MESQVDYMARYLFEPFSEDYYRLMNQTGVKHAFPRAEGNDNFNSVWDGDVAPDGTFYFPLSSEAGKSDHTKLVRYDLETNAIVDCFYAGDVILPHPRHLPDSKLHTSINFLPDGRLIATTHSTDRAKHHSEWMPFGHHNHVWEGFPGSHILVYDPRTGRAENWGIPVPRESIYGAKYDPVHDALYMIGFMRGHVYRYSLHSRQVKDLGKAAELFCYRLVLGADGHIYGVTKTGCAFRINTETEELEDLGYRFPEEPGNWGHNTWYRYMACGFNHHSGEFMYIVLPFSGTLYKLQFATLKISPVGPMLDADGFIPPPSERSSFLLETMAMDKEGVLWYPLTQQVLELAPEATMRYHLPYYLMRWDVDHGQAPECLGVIGSTTRVLSHPTEMAIDEERDKMYCVSLGRGFGADGPNVLAVDLAAFREHMYTPGPITEDPVLQPVAFTEEQIAARRKQTSYVGEEVTANNPFAAFPIRDCFPLRIWREVPPANVEDTKAIGMCYDDGDLLHVLTGRTLCAETARYVFQIKGREILKRLDFGEVETSYRAWLLDHILPGKLEFDREVKLPEATGRRYRAVASAAAEWNGHRQIVGTMDALVAIVQGDRVYSLGHAAAYGPVQCMCTNADKTKLWGVAGDPEDMGYVFYYDDEVGLRQLGIVYYNAPGFYGPTASNELSSIVLNHAEDTLAIGSIDRLSTIHVVSLAPPA